MKEAVLPFNRFPEVDTVLGPEMRSTGEVMGIDARFGLAFAKSQMAAGTTAAADGTVFLSLADRDKPAGIVVARRFAELGFAIVATPGTADVPRPGSACAVADRGRQAVRRRRGRRRSTSSQSGKINLVVNTPQGRGPRADGSHIRTAANVHKVSCLTTVAAALAAAHGMAERAAQPPGVRSLQEWHATASPLATLPRQLRLVAGAPASTAARSRRRRST